MSLKKAYQKMIAVQGIPDTALLLGMSESAMDNRVQERQGQCFTVRQALRMQQISKTTHFAEVIARISRGTFQKLPNVDHIDNDSILNAMNQVHVDIGRWCQKFAEATADGKIDKREKADMDAIVYELHRHTDMLHALTCRVYCPDGDGDQTSGGAE